MRMQSTKARLWEGTKQTTKYSQQMNFKEKKEEGNIYIFLKVLKT